MLGNDAGFVRRRGPYTIGSDSRAVGGPESTFTVSGALQPLRGDELQVVPEGLSSEDVRKFYQRSGSEWLRTADKHKKTPADLVQFTDQYGDIVTYTVTKVEYHGFGLVHQKVTLVRTDEHVPTAFSLGFSSGFE